MVPRLIPRISAKYDRWQQWLKYKNLSKAPTSVDLAESERFLLSREVDDYRYGILFNYFLHGFIAHAGPRFSLIHYPGLPSSRSYTQSGLEGFARTAALLAAWVYSGRSPRVADQQTGAPIDIIDVLRQGVVAGTDPHAKEYWGSIGEYDQRLVESADIARLLWLTRDALWAQLTDGEKTNIVNWLSQSLRAEIRNRNNWILFPVVVSAFLKSVGVQHEDTEANYYEFKDNYLESGWFRDGPTGKVDYYNAWGISYDLYWIHLMDPSLDSAFIEKSITESARLTAHLLSPAGIPIMGRSICYRMAVPAALIAGSRIAPSTISPGLARRGLDATWRYFVRHRALRNGTLTMGYFDTDPRIVEAYLGPGSSHWALRSLTLAFMSEPTDPFWTAEYEPLPVEVGDFVIPLQKLGWTITGTKRTGDIKIAVSGNTVPSVELESFSRWQRLKETFTQQPRRPKNSKAKYGLREYSAIAPLGGAIKSKKMIA
jgi:hypothetical protein